MGLFDFWKKKPTKKEVEYFAEPYKKQVQKDEAKFLFDHAEKQLKETLDASQAIVTRTTTLSTLTVGLMVALVGFSMSRWERIGKIDVALITAIAGLLYLFILSIFLAYNIKPKTYIATGSRPKNFFTDAIFQMKDDERLIFYYVNEIESYQARIEKNSEQNEARWNVFNRCLYALVFIPVFLTLVYLVASIISSRCQAHYPVP